MHIRTRIQSVVALAVALVMVLAGTALASDVSVVVVDVTAPTNGVTLASGSTGNITINMSVTGNQAGTATFEVYRDWTLNGGTFTGSNPQEFTVPPRSGGDEATTFSTSGTVSVAAGQADGTFTLAVDAFDITNSNATGGKLAKGTSSNYSVTVETPIVVPTDTTPPVLTLPADITAEATSAAGAVVTYSASAHDAVDSTVPVSCNPASGSTFPLGTTTVECSAKDTANNTATGSFNVTVRDTTAPTLSNLPANQSAVATSSAGAAVGYTNPTASDAVDANPAVTCLPASGSTFALGTTTVSCTAADSSGNESSPQTFTITVQYASSKILQPVNEDGSSRFKLNSTVPVKIQLRGASAGIGDAVITQSVSKLTNTLWGDELEAVSTATPHSGSALRYDASSDQYIFNLATKPLGTGTFRITLNLGGGKTETAQFSIVK